MKRNYIILLTIYIYIYIYNYSSKFSSTSLEIIYLSCTVIRKLKKNCTSQVFFLKKSNIHIYQNKIYKYLFTLNKYPKDVFLYKAVIFLLNYYQKIHHKIYNKEKIKIAPVSGP
jgi:hypothetical protein